MCVVLTWRSLLVHTGKLNSSGATTPGGAVGHSISLFKFQTSLMSHYGKLFVHH